MITDAIVSECYFAPRASVSQSISILLLTIFCSYVFESHFLPAQSFTKVAMQLLLCSALIYVNDAKSLTTQLVGNKLYFCETVLRTKENVGTFTI